MFKELNTLQVFLEHPTMRFSVRETARILKIAPATASKRLRKLAREGLLKEEGERIFHLYQANMESEKYRDVKIFYTIRKMKDSGLIESLNAFYLKPAIVLFGSASQGLDTETSDIDICILSEKTKDFSEKERFEKELKRKLQFFVVKTIKEIKNSHLANNIINGIVLQGELKWM